MRLTADKAIKEIEAVKISFMGFIVPKFNYQREIRRELCKLAEKNIISPSEYWKALKTTWEKMDKYDKATELAMLR